MRDGKGKQVAGFVPYDFDYSKAERGKYFKRLLKEGSNVVTRKIGVRALNRRLASGFSDSGL
jgi:hypothetical protein